MMSKECGFIVDGINLLCRYCKCKASLRIVTNSGVFKANKCVWCGNEKDYKDG